MSTLLALFQNLGLTELAIILLIVLLLFGSTQIPRLMRSLGSGISQFKKGIEEGKHDDPKSDPSGDKPAS